MEILFRGVGKNTDKWEFGNLVRFFNGDCAIINGSSSDSFILLHVIPETVGQYTGLDDKNGVKIFEGDVMHWDSHWGWYVGYENGAFRRIPLNDIQRWNWKHYPLEQEGLKTWEIIGNIHDNPELME